VALARELLEATELSIKEVAVRVGISDAQYFNKQFRRFSGESPSRYRDRVRAAFKKPEKIPRTRAER